MWSDVKSAAKQVLKLPAMFRGAHVAATARDELAIAVVTTIRKAINRTYYVFMCFPFTSSTFRELHYLT